MSKSHAALKKTKEHRELTEVLEVTGELMVELTRDVSQFVLKWDNSDTVRTWYKVARISFQIILFAVRIMRCNIHAWEAGTELGKNAADLAKTAGKAGLKAVVAMDAAERAAAEVVSVVVVNQKVEQEINDMTRELKEITNELFEHGNKVVKKQGRCEKFRYWCSTQKRGDAGAEIYTLEKLVGEYKDLSKKLKEEEDIVKYVGLDPFLRLAAENFKRNFATCKDKFKDAKFQALFTYGHDNELTQIKAMKKTLVEHIDSTRKSEDSQRSRINRLYKKVATLKKENEKMKNEFKHFRKTHDEKIQNIESRFPTGNAPAKGRPLSAKGRPLSLDASVARRRLLNRLNRLERGGGE